MLRTFLRRSAAATLVLALVSFTLPVHATHSEPCSMQPGDEHYLPEGSTDGQSYPVYVVLDYHYFWQWYVVWIYAESNGVNGLQRHDDQCGFPGIDESNQDVIIY